MYDLKIIVKNSQEIITKDWQLQIAKAKAFWEDLEIRHFKDEKEKNNALNFQKEIENKRNYLKDILKSLDSDEILKLRAALLDFDKLLANKNGDIKRAYEYYKEKEKQKQIEEGFSLVINQENFHADYKIYENDYLSAIKGKSYKEYFEISQKVANDYSQLLENNQLNFDKCLSILENFSKGIGYINLSDWFKQLAKDIVLNGVPIEQQRKKIRRAYEKEKFSNIPKNLTEEELSERIIKNKPIVFSENTVKNIILPIDTQIFLNILKSLKMIENLKEDKSKEFLNNLITQIQEFLQ